jgi:hypothetical protein
MSLISAALPAFAVLVALGGCTDRASFSKIQSENFERKPSALPPGERDDTSDGGTFRLSADVHSLSGAALGESSGAQFHLGPASIGTTEAKQVASPSFKLQAGLHSTGG